MGKSLLKFNSIPELFQEVGNKFPNERALYAPHLKPSVEISYATMRDHVTSLAKGLLEIGLSPGDHIAFFADNGPRWIITDLSILTAGCVTVPRGTDTSTEEMEFILTHSDSKALFLQNRKIYDRLLDSFAFKHLQYVVLMDDQIDSKTVLESGTKVLSYSELLETGYRSVKDIKPEEIKSSDLASIVYTSGTTGSPKGVMLSHKNLVSQPELVNVGYVPQPGDLLLTILPAWHAYERAVEYFSLYHGVTLVYSDKRYIKEDLIRIRPQLFPCVPRIWEMVYNGIQDKISKTSKSQQRLYNFFVKYGLDFIKAKRIVYNNRAELSELSSGDRLTAIARYFLLLPVYFLGTKLIYNKVRRITGGKLMAAISGGGSLPPYLDAYFELMQVPILNGYGLTETSPVISVRRTNSNVRGTVGPILSETQVRIVNEKNEVLSPGTIGEIQVSGPQVMMGYYKNEESTKNVFTSDGWLKTGDLGWLSQQGHLVLSGRAKDTIVLMSGENIEPEHIESAISKNKLINQIILVGQDQKQLGALVVPDYEMLAHELHLSESIGIDEICNHKDSIDVIKHAIKKSMADQGGFKPFEVVGHIKLLQEPFSQENGLLTNTLKIKRNLVLKKYENVISEIFQ